MPSNSIRIGVALLLGTLSLTDASAAEQPCNCPNSGSRWNWNPSWYAGASVAQSTFSDWSAAANADASSYASRTQDDHDPGFRAFGGMAFLKYFALEAGYADYGEARFQAQSDGSGIFWAAGPVAETVSLKGLDLDLLGTLPLFKDTAAFGKLGALRSESRQRITGMTQSSGPYFTDDKHRSAKLLYGAGIQYDGFRPLRLVTAYTSASFSAKFGDPSGDKGRIGFLSLSVAYLF